MDFIMLPSPVRRTFDVCAILFPFVNATAKFVTEIVQRLMMCTGKSLKNQI